MKQHPQSPLMVALDGSGMSADDAAWAAIAATVERQVTLPGLSPAGLLDLLEAWAAARLAAGLPAMPLPRTEARPPAPVRQAASDLR
jgi:hypothetical protein